MENQQHEHTEEICGFKGKRRYKTLSAAQLHAMDAWRRRRIDLRIYDCAACGDWHLTKTAPK